MSKGRFNLFEFDARNNARSTKNGPQFLIGNNMKNTIGSISRMYKYCSRHSKEPLLCTLAPTYAKPIPPNPPTIFNVTSSNGLVNVFFMAGSNSGPPVTNYFYSIDGGPDISGGMFSPILIGGLSLGRVYHVSLKAKNADGLSYPSNTATFTVT